MSLIAWYPLNGSLKNLGVGDMDFTVTTEPTYVDNKFGKGMATGGVKWTAELTTLVLNNKELSIAFWIKVTGTEQGVIFGQQYMTSPNNRHFTIFQSPNANALHLSWLNEETNKTYFACIEYNFFPTNEWVHFCVTYNNPIITIYRNGKVFKTYTGVSNASTFAYATPVINNRAGRILNDMRFYNHCLSPKEVKEISKGLILHYPLNQIDGCIGGRNYVLGNPSISGKNNFSKNYSISSDLINVIRNKYVTFSAEIYGSNMNYAHYGIDLAVSYTDGSSTTWSGFTKGMTELTKVDIERKIYTRTIKIADKEIKAIGGCTIFARGHDDTQGDSIFEVKDLKIELGILATPWTPAPEDVNYDNIICDCSGFGNDGSYSDGVVSDSDTPIGQCSTLLAGTTVDTTSNTLIGAKYIQGKCVMNSADAITVSWWGKINKYGRGGIFETTTYTSDYYKDDDTSGIANWDTIFRMNTSAGSANFNSNIIKADSTWHLNTLTYDGTTAKCYVDGELVQSVALAGTLPTFNGIKMGISRAGGTWRQIDLNVSDLRIYTTALSADDIKELYQTRFQIANNGTLFCTEYVDNEGVKFNKTGVLNSSLLYEDVYTYDMPTKTLSDGSKWARIFYHNNRSGTKYFNKTDDFANSAIIHDDDRYSRLNVLSEYQYNGVYELMACLPDDGNGVWRWTLTNNPVTSTTAGTVSSVTGYNYDSLGLMQCTSNTYLAHSTSGGNWWCAVGCWTKYNGGIPGWGGVIVKGGLELWVRIYNTEDKTSVYKDAVTTRELIEY